MSDGKNSVNAGLNHIGQTLLVYGHDRDCSWGTFSVSVCLNGVH